MVRRCIAWSLAAAVSLSLAGCTGSDSAASPLGASLAPGSERPAEAGTGSVASVGGLDARTYRVVTLGDSYTYGTGTDAPKRDSWPAQLASAMTQRGGVRIRMYNLAEESSDSLQVLEEQLGSVAAQQPDVVTLQVGVNDLVSDEAESYGGNVGAIFDELLGILQPEYIFAITTPDHTLTEWGRARGSREAVAALNASLAEEASARGIAVIDIGPVYERVTVDSSLLVQSDWPKPDPTAKQYAGWAEAIGPYLYDALAHVEP